MSARRAARGGGEGVEGGGRGETGTCLLRALAAQVLALRGRARAGPAGLVPRCLEEFTLQATGLVVSQ